MRDFTQLCDSTQNSISSLKGFQFLLYWWSSIIQDTVESVYNGPPRDLRNWLLKVARLDFLGLIPPQFETSFVRHNGKTRKSCEHGPENGKPKFNQTKRRSDNGGSAGVDCHIYRRRNKYLQRRHGPSVKTRKRVRRLQSSWIVILRKVQNRAELEQHF